MKTELPTQPYRGTRDFFPAEMARLRYVFGVWRKVCLRFGYEEYLGPLLEPWEVYARKNVSGREIVDQQLYWFEDRGGRKVAIRPEMTPTVSRMVAARAPQLPKPIRWFSIANFMRYERPQHGRAREFFQLNADIFGGHEVAADAELIEMAVSLMREFGADENMFEIRINNRKWVDWWLRGRLQIDQHHAEIVRVIDQVSKQSEEKTRNRLGEYGLSSGQIDGVLAMSEFQLTDLDRIRKENGGAEELVQLFELLDARGLKPYVRFDGRLMRGLDYYTGNVFEQFDLNPENRRSMFGGGRYAGLVSVFGGQPMSASGFAPGDLTTLQFLEGWHLFPDLSTAPLVLVTIFDREHAQSSWDLANYLRAQGIAVELYLKVDESISVQLGYAHRKKIPVALILGPGEIDAGNVVCKDLVSGVQQVFQSRELVDYLREQVVGKSMNTGGVLS